MKGSVGVELGVAIALLWGTADILISTAARHIGIFKTSIIAQAAGMVLLLLTGTALFIFRRQTVPLPVFEASLLLGIFTGLCATFGYFSLYSALKTGPLALVSPISASSSCITFLLIVLIHEEPLSLRKTICTFIVITGVVLASTNIKEVRQLLQKPAILFLNPAMRQAVIAMLAFGCMDFGIGVSASFSGWFLPVLWTRFFSLFFLIIFFVLRRYKKYTLLDRQETYRSSNSMRQPAIQQTSYQVSLPVHPSVDFMASLSTVAIPRVQAKIHTAPASLKRVVMVPLLQSPMPTTSPTYKDGADMQSGWSHRSMRSHFWWWIAILAGVVENIAIFLFSFDTRIATIGITSALASCYGIVGAFFGVAIYNERLSKNQLYGIGMCLLGIFLLTL